MKTYLLAISMASVFCVSAFAEKSNRTMSVTVSPLQLFQLSLDGKYALKLHDRIALTAPVTFQFLPEIGGFSSRYFAAGVGAKFFLSNSAFESGWYVEPSVMAGYSKVQFSGLYPFNTPFMKASVLGGYGIVLKNGFTMNFGLGLNYNYAFSHEAPSISKVAWGVGAGPITALTNSYGITSGFSPNAEISIGYSW